MIRLAVCPHDTGKDVERWYEFKRYLEEKLGEEVSFEPFKDFEDEKRRLEEDFDLYYASPSVSLALFKRGYRPIAKIKDSKDRFLVIGEGKPFDKEKIKVALVPLKATMMILLRIKIPFDRVELVPTRSHRETLECVKERKVDLGIIHEEAISEEDIGDLMILKDLGLETSHLFMAKPREEGRLKYALLSLDYIEEANEDDLSPLLELDEKLQELLERWKEHDITRAVLNAPDVGIMIYREKVLFVNRFLCELLGYSEEEMKEYGPEHFVTDEYKALVRETVARRLKGEMITRSYRKLKLQRKDGSYRWALVFSNTILYEGKHAGFVIVFDITKQVRLESLYELLKEVNQAIVGSFLEEELFERICKALIEKLGLRFVWVGAPDEKGWVRPVYSYGYEDGYLNTIRISLDPKVPEGRGPTGSAFREGRIIINPDTRKNPLIESWRENMLKRGYLSSAAIPIQRNGKTIYTLNLYASEPLFFEEENREILEELKRDLEFALEKLEENRKSFIVRKALESSDLWMVETDVNGTILYANDAVCRISGYRKEELLGKNPRIFKSGYHSQEFYKNLWDTILSGKEFYSLFVNRKKNGELFHIKQTIMPVELPGGEIRFLGIGRDVTKEVELLEEIERFKFYDPLTGLLNYNGFSFKVSEILRNIKDIALMIHIDIYNFTYINSALGYRVGDEVLKKVGQRLRRSFRDTDIIARVGSDEFALLVQPLKRRRDAFAVVEKLKSLFEEPFNIAGESKKLGLHAGVSLFPDDGREFSELYKRASLALSRAKAKGSGEVNFFNPGMEDEARSFIRTESLLEKAVDKNLFLFFYQPYFRTEDLSLAGFEALVRIKDEEGNIHPPSEFIDFLENSRFLENFEEWMLAEVTKKIRDWNMSISVNLSGRSFSNDKFMGRFLRICRALKGKIAVELTERILIEDLERSKRLLRRMRSCAKVIIDDFGTGYSSLAYLKELPIDLVKIDKSFTKGMVTNPKDRALVEVIVEFAKKLRLETLAEGVETDKQLRILRSIGCTYVQGFLLAKPMPEEDVERLYLR